MYNEEIKKRFIEERNNEVILPPDYLKTQFDSIASFEEELGKDVRDFNLYEIKEYYKMLNTASVGRLKVLNSQLSLYTQWCLQQNLVKDNQNHFLEMTDDNFDDCINKMLLDEKIISRSTILEWARKCINPRDAFIILAPFEGIAGKEFCEIVNLKETDVDGNKVTLCDGRTIEVSNELKAYIYDCINETRYYGANGRSFELSNNGFVLKDYINAQSEVSDFQRGRRVYNSLRRTLKALDKVNVINSNDIYNSGIIDMIKRLSNQHGMSCIDFIMSPKISEVEEKYGCKIQASGFIMKYRDYLD